MELERIRTALIYRKRELKNGSRQRRFLLGRIPPVVSEPSRSRDGKRRRRRFAKEWSPMERDYARGRVFEVIKWGIWRKYAFYQKKSVGTKVIKDIKIVVDGYPSRSCILIGFTAEWEYHAAWKLKLLIFNRLYYKTIYPMSVLMNAGIWDILIISISQNTPRFQDLLGNTYQFGVERAYICGSAFL